jgi:BirA family biotin operon repressor/biotin-[acetyl-CoA-carboxylase] ligase
MTRWDCFKTDVLQPKVIEFDELDSTNNQAKERLEKGDHEGAIVLARSQTAGRGRRGREWLSPSGGLYFSLIVRPRVSTEQTPLLGILASCAVCTSLREMGVGRATVKWPNDVLVGDSKICGILAESVSVGGEIVGVVLGVGVNQNSVSSELESRLGVPVASVRSEVGAETSQEELLCSIVNEVDRLISLVEHSSSFAPILESWRDLTSTIGRKVRVFRNGETLDGIAQDIGEDGSLVVETDVGVIRVLAGDVAHLRDL